MVSNHQNAYRLSFWQVGSRLPITFPGILKCVWPLVCVCFQSCFPQDVEITTARRLCTRVQRKRKREHFLEGPIKYLLWFYWLEVGYIYIPEPIIISQEKRFMFVFRLQPNASMGVKFLVTYTEV